MTAEQLTLLLNTVITVFIPVLVGLVTKEVTSSGAKALILLVLTLINTLVGQIVVAIGTGTFQWYTWILAFIANFVIGVAVHYGLWKPTGVSAAAQRVGS